VNPRKVVRADRQEYPSSTAIKAQRDVPESHEWASRNEKLSENLAEDR